MHTNNILRAFSRVHSSEGDSSHGWRSAGRRARLLQIGQVVFPRGEPAARGAQRAGGLASDTPVSCGSEQRMPLGDNARPWESRSRVDLPRTGGRARTRAARRAR